MDRKWMIIGSGPILKDRNFVNQVLTIDADPYYGDCENKMCTKISLKGGETCNLRTRKSTLGLQLRTGGGEAGLVDFFNPQ